MMHAIVAQVFALMTPGDFALRIERKQRKDEVTVKKSQSEGMTMTNLSRLSRNLFNPSWNTYRIFECTCGRSTQTFRLEAARPPTAPRIGRNRD